MYQGRFPTELPHDPPPYRRRYAAVEHLDPTAQGRRRVVLGLGVFVFGSLAGGAIARWVSGGTGAVDASGRADGDPREPETPGSAATDSKDAPAPRGSIEWALGLLDVPDEELLAAAGDLERVSAKHRREPSLVPCFRRLLDVSLRCRLPEADMAAACAIRSLQRLGRPDLVRDRGSDIARRSDLVQAAEAFERVMEKARGGGGR